MGSGGLPFGGEEEAEGRGGGGRRASVPWATPLGTGGLPCGSRDKINKQNVKFVKECSNANCFFLSSGDKAKIVPLSLWLQ